MKNEVKKLLIIFYQSCMIFFIWFAFTGCKSQMNNIRINQLPAIDSTVSFRGIYAVSDTKVWATGSSNAIFRTNNGGQSWEQMIVDDSLTLDFRDVHITSVGDIFVMSSGPGNQSRIYRSSDNGGTWNISYINPHDEGFLNSIAFWNDSTGIAVGDPVNGQIFILATHDNGNSWNAAQPGTVPPALLGEIGFAASGTSVVVSGDSLAWIGTGGPEARVYYTTNLGTSWHVTNTPLLHGGETTGIYSVQFFSENIGFIAGGDYTTPDSMVATFGRSIDGGKSWRLVGNQQVPFQTAIDQVNSNQEIFISTGTAGTYFSINGIYWNLLTDIGFNCLSAAPSGKIIWLAGANGRVAQIIVND